MGGGEASFQTGSLVRFPWDTYYKALPGHAPGLPLGISWNLYF